MAEFGSGGKGTIVNDTGLPDNVVEGAVMDYFAENSSMAWGRQTNFQTYAAEGSLLARRPFTTPTNVVDEIKLARELAEKDDDIGPAIGQMLALAFGDGMANHHRDEKTVALFNEIAGNMDLDLQLQELYRELLISSQINAALLFTRETLEFHLDGSDRTLSESVAAPLLGVLPAEQIRVIGNDMFRTGVLAYEPDNEALRRWLDEFFDPRTEPARKAALGRADRVSAALFTGVVELTNSQMLDPDELPALGGKLYTLNPRMVARTTFPKGSWKYPRPLLTRDFALLEAKRLLNIMDYALLQGGSNFIVVAKKGTDERPAKPSEVENLQQVVRRASKTGVIVGDHRLSFEIITPKLDELLNSGKRRLIGRKMAMAMLRLAEHGDEEGGSEGIKSDDETLARVISSDRRIIKRLVERHAYGQAVKRNPRLFTKGAPSIWFPKIVLQGTQVFTDMILKLRDRGDIPRRWAVEAAGFPWDAAVEERRREVSRGDDEVMQPGSVPHSSPDAGPQDNNPGRPTGSKTGGGGQDPAAPRPVLHQNPGETIRSWYEEEVGQVVRVGERTEAILEEYEERSIGRVTQSERDALEFSEPEFKGSTLYVPVNPGYDTRNEKAVRLDMGLSMIVGEKANGGDEGAFVAKLICFRETDINLERAEEMVLRWGFPVRLPRSTPAALPAETAETAAQPVEVHVHPGEGGKKRRMKIERDAANNVIGVVAEDEPDAD